MSKISRSGEPPAGDVRRLLRKARGGSNSSLGQLFAIYRPFLLTVAREEFDPDLRKKGSPSDLVQETFIDAQKDFAQFTSDSKGDFRVWLRALLLNNLADFRRRYKQAAKRRVQKERSITDPEAQEFLDLLAKRQPDSPSKRALAREEAQRVREALDRLRPEYRQIILWRSRDRLSLVEIGRRLDRSVNAARMLLARAMRQLKKELGGKP